LHHRHRFLPSASAHFTYQSPLVRIIVPRPDRAPIPLNIARPSHQRIYRVTLPGVFQQSAFSLALPILHSHTLTSPFKSPLFNHSTHHHQVKSAHVIINFRSKITHTFLFPIQYPHRIIYQITQCAHNFAFLPRKPPRSQIPSYGILCCSIYHTTISLLIIKYTLFTFYTDSKLKYYCFVHQHD
jgi:hypothetical protein